MDGGCANLNGELSAVYVVVLVPVLLDGDVGEVDVLPGLCVHLAHRVVVTHRAETPETVLVQVDCAR